MRFLVARSAPDWHLTYGQSATILFGGGVGAVVGRWSGGALSDKRGRKALIVGDTFIFAFGAGAISLIPDGAWLLRRRPPIQVMSDRVKPGSLAAGTTSGIRDSVASRDPQCQR